MPTSTPDLPSTRSGRARLAGFDGLRGVACRLVFIGHVAAATWLFGRFTPVLSTLAFVGLLLFFVLSGFLLYRPFAAAIMLGHVPPRSADFLHNRFWRIAPAYVLILLVVAFALGTAVTDADTILAASQAGDVREREVPGTGYLTDPWLLVPNLLLLQSYAPTTVVTGIGPAWSLSVEIAFYLCLPLLAAGAARLGRGRRLRRRVLAALVPVGALLAVGYASKTLGTLLWPTIHEPASHWGETWLAVLNRSFLMWADGFAYGMAAAVVVVLVREGRLHVPARTVAMATGAAIVACVVAFAALTLPMQMRAALIGVVLGGGVLTVALTTSTTRTRRALDVGPIAALGVISYSFYLWHAPLAYFVYRHLQWEGRAGMAAMVGVVTVLCVGVSAATYRWVERPGLRRKRGDRPVGGTPPATAGFVGSPDGRRLTHASRRAARSLR